MAVRVTHDDVLEIMDSDCTVSHTVIDNLIITANAIINKVFAGDNTMSEDMLKAVEQWFTAHMIASTLWRTTADEKIGDAAVTYTGKWGFGLDLTPYGQMVKQLDVTGKMAKIGLKGASIYAIPNFDE
jgi:hypothetical protein